MKKPDELHHSTGNHSSESNLTSSISCVRKNRMLTDTVSAPNPSLESKISLTGASNASVSTTSTSDGSASTLSSIKSKALAEAIIPITLEYLREQKNFLKLQHKQDKDSTLMKKKHAKEQTTLGEQQSKIMCRAKSDSEKTTRSPMIQTGNRKKDLRYLKRKFY
jgi:hypothetical protein